MKDRDDRPTALYRLYDSGDRLLYVGISYNPSVRYTAHKMNQFWWPLVSRREVKWFPSRSEAAQAEREAIREGDPMYNTVGSPSLVQVDGIWTRYLDPLPREA